ncbi:MAG: GntR family transcriptional regulator [Planctomycetota bacterium]|nr:GntR family transcriptional regulator [Planctomycetota bacterium]
MSSEATPPAEEKPSLRHHGTPVGEPLVKDIREQVRSGKLKPGDPILTVRELMKEYGISYNSVRRALGQLAEEGLLSLEQGRGTFVKAAPSAPPAVPPPAPRLEAAAPEEPELFDTSTVIDTRLVGLRALRERRTVAVALPAPTGWEAQPHLEAILRGIRQRAAEGGDALLLYNSHPRRPEVEPEALRAAGAQGVLLLGTRPRAELERWANAEPPAVLVDQVPHELPLNAVAPDHFSAGYQVARLLTQAGLRQFALLRPRSAPLDPGAPSAEREDGLRLALKEDGVAWDDDDVLELAPEDLAPDAAVSALKRLKRAPAAVLADGDGPTRALAAGLEPYGGPAAERPLLAGFVARDDYLPPTAAAARTDYARLGALAFDRLRQILAGAPSSPIRISVPVEVVRGRLRGARA